jgi:hypothetical protein
MKTPNHRETEGISRVIPAHPFLIRIHLEHVLRPVRIMLERRQRPPNRAHRR